MKHTIIGINGKAGSGKDTAAGYIEEEYGYKSLSLASPIKDLVGWVFNFSDKQLWGSSSHREQVIPIDWYMARGKLEDKADEWLAFFHGESKKDELINTFKFLKEHYHDALSARIAAQVIGTDFGRTHLGEDVWVKHLFDRASYLFSVENVEGIVISDVRFLNEVEAIHNKGGKVIKLLRNADKPDAGIPGHVSERELSDLDLNHFDCTISNQKTIKDLYEALDVFLSCSCCEEEG